MAVSRDGVGFVDASQLLDLSRSLKGVKDARKMRAAVGSLNRQVVEFVAERARAEAAGNRQAAAVADDPSAMVATGTPDKASLRLVEDTSAPKKDPRRFAFGAEFGSKHDVERVLGVRKIHVGTKGTGKSRRNIYAKDYQQAHTILGWNQFRDWRGSGNAHVDDVEPGYFMWPAIRDAGPEAAQMYGLKASEILASALAAPFTGGTV